VLTVLARTPGESRTELGAQLDLDRSTIADIMARLERRGLIERGIRPGQPNQSRPGLRNRMYLRLGPSGLLLVRNGGIVVAKGPGKGVVPAMVDHVYSVTELVGTSADGVDAAIKVGIDRAASTLRGLDWFEVTEIRGHIVDGRIGHYQVGLKVGFRVENPE
jgi:dodecin